MLFLQYMQRVVWCKKVIGTTITEHKRCELHFSFETNFAYFSIKTYIAAPRRDDSNEKNKSYALWRGFMETNHRL